ncbi:hypothetical protein [Crossiella cryophila]|uniref:Uncharacterized protein n=1 Tax=Crossiella cryophila TaxID=43355 RepID=A0A7W7CAP4_9PSEU|nr:hypothetical protein [Crossiella cryophila]MBB4677682.1 hypothetical protein [Crossiella cryophila]
MTGPGERVKPPIATGSAILGTVALLPMILFGPLFVEFMTLGMDCSREFPRGGGCDPATRSAVNRGLLGGFGASVLLMVAAYVFRRARPWNRRWLVLGSLAVAVATLGVAVSVRTERPSPADRTWSEERERAAEHEREIAAMRARSPLEEVRARLESARAELDRRLAEAVPGVRWPSLFRQERPCSGHPEGRELTDRVRLDSSPPQVSGPGGREFSAEELRAIEQAFRAALRPAGFTGPPLEGGRDGERWTPLRDPEEATLRLWVQRGRVSFSFGTQCHLPRAVR